MPLENAYRTRSVLGVFLLLLLLFYFTHSDRYEIAVGLNGRVWVHSGSVTNTILIANAIINSEQLPAKHVESMVQQLLQRAEKQ
jgi:exosome complex RNA-binding protein Rrp4